MLKDKIYDSIWQIRNITMNYWDYVFNLERYTQ